MGLALDEPKERDTVVDQEDIKFLLGPELKSIFSYGHHVEVDYNPYWKSFRVRLEGVEECC